MRVFVQVDFKRIDAQMFQLFARYLRIDLAKAYPGVHVEIHRGFGDQTAFQGIEGDESLVREFVELDLRETFSNATLL